jgi:hypothetical protein
VSSFLVLLAVLIFVVFCFLLGWALAVVSDRAGRVEDERFYIPTPEALRLRGELGDSR